MLTGETSRAQWSKLCAGNPDYFRSRQGRRAIKCAVKSARLASASPSVTPPSSAWRRRFSGIPRLSIDTRYALCVYSTMCGNRRPCEESDR